MATTKDTPTQHSTPGTLILQWLTYVFWGLTVLALSVLIFIVIFNLISGSYSENASLYALAAIIVLLPISLVCDFLYQKREPKKKVGAAAAILAIHAVIFALCGIGVLVSGLFAAIRLATESTSAAQSNSEISWIVSAAIVTLLYAALFVRTLNPGKFTKWLPKTHAITMGVVIATFTVLAFTGPFATTLKDKDDRFIRDNIGTLSNSIENYTFNESKLPESLEALAVRNKNLERLIEEKLVTYKIDENQAPSFRYQLCAHYTGTYTGDTYDHYDFDTSSDGYYNYISFQDGHTPGEHCYKLKIDMGE